MREATPDGRKGGYLTGAAWSALNAGAGVALPFLLFIFFARHIAPVQVGWIVFATSVAEIVKAFGLPGVYEALLQQPARHRESHQSAFALLCATGALLWLGYGLVMAALSLAFPALAEHPVLYALIGLRVPFDLIMLQPQAALAQGLAYRRMAMRSVGANILAGVIGVTVALAGWPLQGLVAYLAGQSLFVLLFTILRSGVLVRPRWHGTAVQAMRREALAASSVRMVAALNNYFDQIIVAAVIGSAGMAYFNLGKRIETTFITASSSFSSILFQPLFSLQNAQERMDGLYRGLSILGFLCGVPCAFVIANAHDLVATVFGASWLPATPVVAVLAVSGFVRALGSVHGALLSVSGGNRVLSGVTMTSAATGIAAVCLMAPFGTLAVAVALAVKNASIVGWMAHLTRPSLPAPLRHYLRGIVLPLAAMIATGFAAAALTRPLCLPFGQYAVLAVSLAAITAVGLLCFLPALMGRKRAASGGAAVTAGSGAA